MPDFDTVKYAIDDNVAIVTISRPDAMNSFNDDLRRDLHSALEVAANDKSIRVVILTGEGRTVSAGADLQDIDTGRSIDEMLQQEYRPVFESIGRMEKPVIAAVGGSVAGLGMSMA